MRHVAISGDLGSGKSTVARLLSTQLGWEMVSTGEIQRSIARELSVSTLEANHLATHDESIDARIDGVTLHLAKTSTRPLIFDSRMAWHFLPDALRVRLVVDPGVAASRILGRGPTDVESYQDANDVHRLVFQRSQAEVERFQTTYSVDITSFENFDLVIDASDLTPSHIAGIVASALTDLSAPVAILSPRRIVPCIAVPSGDAGPLGYWRPFFTCGAEAEAMIEDWLRSGSPTTSMPLSSIRRIGGMQPELNTLLARRWEGLLGTDYDSYREWGQRSVHSR